MGFPCGSAGKESACNAEDLGSIPGLNTYERYALQIIYDIITDNTYQSIPIAMNIKETQSRFHGLL